MAAAETGRKKSRTGKISQKERQWIYQSIEEISTSKWSFYVMVVLSTVIASYGLLANSVAVVIGAMLVAPLMGPIFGIALGISSGDGRLLGKAFLSEILGLILAVLLSFVIGLLPLRLDFGSEILARTQPTLYDIIIALASGLAGAYAMIDERISPALPGVAIATAIVPPLATCGLCLSAGQLEWALGAFLLFFANFLSIQLASAFIFTVLGLSEAKPHEPYTVIRFLKRFGLSLLALAVVALFMTRTLAGLIADRQFSDKLNSAIARETESTIGAQLSSVTYKKKGKTIEVAATVLTPQEFSPQDVERIEKTLKKRVDPEIHLIMRSMISKDFDDNGPAFIGKAELERRQKESRQAQFISTTNKVMSDEIKKVAGAHLVELSLDTGGERLTVKTLIDTPIIIDPSQVKKMEESLEAALGVPVHLIVRSAVTRVADSERYLYEVKSSSAPLSGKALEFHSKLQKALVKNVSAMITGASLDELHYIRKDDRLIVLVVLRTPVNTSPAVVKKIEARLRKAVDPKLDLVVRSNVGTDTSSSGYVKGFDESVFSQH
jgi:uncharacterized hydrophobic protein (TIGR00271 family)